MDSAKFYYNARGSLHESKHWADLLCERNLIADATHKDFVKQAEILGVKLNNFISSVKKQGGKVISDRRLFVVIIVIIVIETNYRDN
jgi:hypothetical protein